MTPTIFIFRHGETVVTKNHLVGYGKHETNLNTPILAEGKPAIVNIGNYLKDKKITQFFASEYLRVQQTVEIITEIIGKTSITDKNINEFEYQTEEIKVLDKRTDNFLNMHLSGATENIAICTHGAVIAALSTKLQGLDFTPDLVVDYPVPGVLREFQDKEMNEIDFN